MNQKTAQLNSPTSHFSVQLSPTPRGARLARLLATERLHAWDLPYGVAETAAHLVAELAANAATHGRAPGRGFLLVLRTTDDGHTLRIEVTDARGDRLPITQPPSLSDESRRGLLLVEALADRWGVTHGPVPRKTVGAELDLVTPERGGQGSGGTGGLSQETKARKEPPPNPTPPARRAGSPPRVNIANWTGGEPGCVPYAHRDAQP
ncbi:hypothetical protein GCM10020367_37780 [Streptomyces sannanensis]|uniref:Histidine kinase/HSP90-like ATPase domain-containing protein n=1 Tax=Streptomyces sannanensis TaxID=285536 RepID=A0ABP6SDS6_9ACTN